MTKFTNEYSGLEQIEPCLKKVVEEQIEPCPKKFADAARARWR